ncbi:MAG TPA: CoA protein activase, partial [Nitrospirae bacterium]|nr:CoA protein activase [Nitrospirota bacterium]
TFNKSVVAAFEKYLDKQIIAPPNHDVTGAIGMAIIAMRHMEGQKSIDNPPKDRRASRQRTTTFKGFDLSKRKYEIKSFECKGCDNLCEINRVKIEGEKDPLFYGSRCEKYDVKRKKKSSSEPAMPDLFAEREHLLTKAHNKYIEKSEIRNPKSEIKSIARIGIPNIFFFHDYLPFWSTLLWELGFEVETSGETSRPIINKGVESILAESCFPHKVAHGHIKALFERKVDAILIPSFIDFDSTELTRSYACPYAQTMPYIANVTFNGNGSSGNKTRVLRPVVDLSQGEKYFLKEIHRSLKPFNVSMGMIKKSVAKAKQAQEEFVSAIKKRGREILDNIDKKTIVIAGRSYNAFDPGVNLEIPKKLADIGVFSIPMDFLPIEAVDITKTWPNMYWRSGQNLLKAAEIIRDHPYLFALYIGNFSCGPDSFIHRFFKEAMGGKPFLQLEIDEHSAGAGVITRCEAFIDSIMERKNIPVRAPGKIRPLSLGKGSNNRVVYIPRMSDHSFGLASAFESCGVDAEVMDTPDLETVKVGRRHVSGKECYPCAITTGDMVKKTMASDFDPSRAAFFMPSGSGPCRFGQYNILHRLVLDKIGLAEVPIFAPNQDTSLYRDLGIIGNDFTRQAWKGIIAVDLLIKCLHETRPYEINKGETESVYNEFLRKIRATINGSRNGAHIGLLRGIKQVFSQIPKNSETRPLIGIIGEIFVRQNAFSNEDVIKKVEQLGGEVWLAPFEEWIYYVNFTAARRAVRRLKKDPFDINNLGEILSLYISRSVQKKVEHKFSNVFKGSLRSLREPSTAELLKNASPYLHDSFEGEAVLSMGKAIDFVKNGSSGIISVMPFGCMPGTIVSALLKGLKQDRGIPCLSVAYDGAEANCFEIQLEAFMHQTHEHNESSK